MTDLTPDGAATYDPPSYDIAPEDHDTANAILSQNPANLPGTFEVHGNLKLPDTMAIDGLPPKLREAALAKVAAVPASRRADAQAGAVAEVLRENSLEIRSKTGFAPSVDPYWREWADITREHNDALAEYDKLTAAMAEVKGWETVEGADGTPEPKPIFAMSPARMESAAVRQRELLHRMDLLISRDGSHGVEAERRLAKALHDSVELRKAVAAQVDEHAEARALAAKTLRDERIQRKADALARNGRNIL